MSFIESCTYTVDNAGHRTSVTEQSGRTVNYSYDNLYRLTNETVASDPNGMNGVASYTYDNVGNRLQKTSTLPGFPGGSSTYNANDELTTDQYDADGNTVGSGLNTGTSGYVYDFENRLVQQAGISIVYDGNGNRVQKMVGGRTTQYLVADLNPTGYPQVVWDNTGTYVNIVYGLELVVRRQDSTRRFYVHDGHGSVRALTDENGNITDTYDYDAFGVLTHSTGTTANNYLFAGEEYDPDLHLYYNRARYLNTSMGRFWTMDTLEGDGQLPTSLNKYTQVANDPVDSLDSSGNQIDDIATFGASETIDNIPELNVATALSTVATGGSGKFPLSGKALDKYIREKARLLKQADCLACDIFLYSRGIDPDIWKIYIKLQIPYDGRKSTISNIDAGLTVGWSKEQIDKYGKDPVKNDFVYPANGTVASAQAPGSDAYFDGQHPEFITQSEVGHEALHNMTGLTDDQLALALRITLGAGSTDAISNALVANQCAGKD